MTFLQLRQSDGFGFEIHMEAAGFLLDGVMVKSAAHMFFDCACSGAFYQIQRS